MSTLTLPLFSAAGSIATTPEVDTLVASGAPVAIGVSGGKDSSAVAIATTEYLDRVGHAGPRVLVHSDLGLVEWRESLPACHRLADRLGLELLVVRRAAGGLMERWEVRWRNNVDRYASLRCVKLILPWSTPSMRFCTSELKTKVIGPALSRRYPGQTILSVTGIRREESERRSRAPVCRPQPELSSRLRRTSGVDWNPILEWTLPDVLGFLLARDFALHEAYTVYGSTRVSCAFCILASRADLRAASLCEANADLYRRMVALEVASTFSFQEAGWLADVAPHLLDGVTLRSLARAKVAAECRTAAEKLIPPDLLYEEGWPRAIPTLAAAGVLCEVRKRVADVVGLTVDYTDPGRLIERYAELWQHRHGIVAPSPLRAAHGVGTVSARPVAGRGSIQRHGKEVQMAAKKRTAGGAKRSTGGGKANRKGSMKRSGGTRKRAGQGAQTGMDAAN